jgi:hypothetical protein
MTASRGRRRRSSTRRRRLNAILFSIIGFIVLLFIIGALAGSHGTKPGSAQSPVTAEAPALVTASVSPATVTQPSASRVRSPDAAASATPRPASPRSATSRPVAVPSTSRPPAPKATPTRSASPTAAAPAGCNPKTNAGNCYEPGEYCRDDDHGMTGLAGDGKEIKCEDNDGWRWEPV